MAIEPISLQLGNYGVEHLAQTSKTSLAQAQQTSQMSEILKESIKKAEQVQPSDEVLSAEKVHRKTDEERREEKNKQEQADKKQKSAQQDESEEQKTTLGVPVQKNGRYDFYV